MIRRFLINSAGTIATGCAVLAVVGLFVVLVGQNVRFGLTPDPVSTQLAPPTTSSAGMPKEKVRKASAPERRQKRQRKVEVPITRREPSPEAERVGEGFKRLYRYYERLFAHVEEAYQQTEQWASLSLSDYSQPRIRSSMDYVRDLRAQAAGELEAEYINSGRTTEFSKRTLAALDTYLDAMRLCYRNTQERGEWLTQAGEKHAEALAARERVMDLFGGYRPEGSFPGDGSGQE